MNINLHNLACQNAHLDGDNNTPATSRQCLILCLIPFGYFGYHNEMSIETYTLKSWDTESWIKSEVKNRAKHCDAIFRVNNLKVSYIAENTELIAQNDLII